MGHFSEYYLTYTAEDARMDKADGLPALQFPKASAQTENAGCEAAFERLTASYAAELGQSLRTARGRGAFEAMVQHAMTHCSECGAEHEVGADACPNGHDLSLPF